MTIALARRSLTLLAVPFALAAGDAAAAELTLKRVLLSSGGVGYFEYEATVSGDEVLNLPVRLDQVDDVMKSLVVYDSKGGIGAVSLPGRQPLAEVFRDLPFDEYALSSPADLLNALRGAEVTVTGARTLSGRILSVTQEQVQLPNGEGLVTRTRVSLMTPLGVSQFLLEDTDSLTFTDPALQAAVEKALMAMSEHGAKDERVLQVTTLGQGERHVVVGYVVETPLWKSSYRLTLDSDPAAKLAELQGWAVLENMSGEDWKEFELTLVSGNPVTFRQALYQSYYVDRPEVPVEVMGRVLPPVDEEQAQANGRAKKDGDQGGYDDRSLAEAAPASPAPEAYYGGEGMADQVAQESANVTAAASSEATTQVIFTFPGPVTVDAGNSLLLPFIARDVPAERLAFWQPNVHPTNPLAAVEIENDGESGLPPGVITLYEREAGGGVSFVGDARLGVLPSGESRLISFAVDQKVSVREETRSDRIVTQVTITKGVMTLTSKETYRVDYEITGAAKEDRVVLLQHPRMYGWTLVEPAEDQIEVTPDSYRARIAVAAGGKATFAFVFEQPVAEQVYLSGLDDSSLVYYLESDFLSAEAKEQLSILVDLRATLADKRRELADLEAEIAQIIADQTRIRENLKSVPAESDLQRRYLETLNQQEDELIRLRDESAKLRAEVKAAEGAVSVFVGQLTL
jgi:hypothetical protein